MVMGAKTRLTSMRRPAVALNLRPATSRKQPGECIPSGITASLVVRPIDDDADTAVARMIDRFGTLGRRLVSTLYADLVHRNTRARQGTTHSRGAPLCADLGRMA